MSMFDKQYPAVPALADCEGGNFASGDFEDRREKYLATLTGIANHRNFGFRPASRISGSC
jgi:hypothetical protein